MSLTSATAHGGLWKPSISSLVLICTYRLAALLGFSNLLIFSKQKSTTFKKKKKTTGGIRSLERGVQKNHTNYQIYVFFFTRISWMSKLKLIEVNLMELNWKLKWIEFVSTRLRVNFKKKIFMSGISWTPKLTELEWIWWNWIEK